MVADCRFKPLTPDRWKDFEKLLGPRGACGGCWCMFWKLTSQEYGASVYEGNRRAQKAIVGSGRVPGLIACIEDEPVGWIAVEPRLAYPRLARSRILKPVDDKPVWSVTCFFIQPQFRGRGITVALLRAAILHVKRHRGKVVEGYPIEPKAGRLPATSAYVGLADAFRKAGFKEVARRAGTRPIFRCEIGG